eukprot:6184568-Pleurochrysis_carterae.AAC.4
MAVCWPVPLHLSSGWRCALGYEESLLAEIRLAGRAGLGEDGGGRVVIVLWCKRGTEVSACQAANKISLVDCAEEQHAPPADTGSET